MHSLTKKKQYEKLSQNFKVVSHIFRGHTQMDKTLELRDSGFKLQKLRIAFQLNNRIFSHNSFNQVDKYYYYAHKVPLFTVERQAKFT